MLADYGRPYMLESLTAPVIVKYNWVFNAQDVDFNLAQITYLEETSGSAVKLRVNGSEFWVPSTWYILVTEEETYQVDTVSVQSCATTTHLAFSFAPDEMRLRTLPIEVIDYIDDISLVHPMIAKGNALCHPVGPTPQHEARQHHLSVVIGPHDLYKFIQNKTVGDLFS
jgi:hypothetical protein